MIVISVCTRQGLLLRIFLNSHSIVCPCHLKTMVMAAMIFFTEMPEWHWHYDQFMVSLYLTTTSRVHLYIFFQCAFVVPVFSPIFDHAAPFLGVPLYMAHPDPVSPYQEQPPTPPQQYVPQGSSKSDPSEMMDSSSTSSLAPDDEQAPGDPKSAGIVLNKFLSSDSGQGSYPSQEIVVVQSGPLLASFMTLGHRYSFFCFLMYSYQLKCPSEGHIESIFIDIGHLLFV